MLSGVLVTCPPGVKYVGLIDYSLADLVERPQDTGAVCPVTLPDIFSSMYR